MIKTIHIKVALLIFLVFSSFPIRAWQDISRGHQSGELYFASVWYWLDDEDSYNVICYSDDYGQSLSFKYVCNIFQGDMLPANILNDEIHGVFYNYKFSPAALYISNDSCVTWSEIVPPGVYSTYSAGNSPGLIYKVWTNEPQWRVELMKSEDYGNSFVLTNDSVGGRSEVGTEPNEVYHYHLYQDDSTYLKINYSSNYGNSFVCIGVHDNNISGFQLMGNRPQIMRGKLPGELYLVSWHLPENFKIFYSMDYGASFQLRYSSAQCDLYYEGYTFTPGYDQGTFYYIKGIPWYDNVNTKVHIYYSSDTAKTFTEHIHILDSNFPVGVYNEDVIEHKLLSFYNYPNPFTNTTTLKFDNIEPGNYIIEITSLSGQAVLRKEEYLDTGDNQVQLTTSSFSPGVYLCAIKQNGQVVGVQKMVKR